jgi:hypothetical protein
MLAGCGASAMQPSGGAVVPQGAGPSVHADGRSWMAAKAKSENLLYLSDVVTNDVYVYSYPQGRLVGTLKSLGQPRSECADAAGDVWIADVQAYQIVEYPHGATKPIVALSTFGAPHGCSVDSKSGDLAVAGGLGGLVLSVFHRGPHNVWRDAKRYSDSAILIADFCGYDAAGNLFVDGVSKKNGGSFRLAELPYRGNALVNITVSQSVKAPGQVQWDGNDVAVGDTGVSPSVVYQLAVSGSSATEIGSTTLGGTTSVRQFWIQAKDLIGPDYDVQVGFWSYPSGGSPTKTLTGLHGYGAAVSLR